jgi:hypothetical protein
MEIMSKSILTAEEVIEEICTQAGNHLYEKYLAERLIPYQPARAMKDIEAAPLISLQ